MINGNSPPDLGAFSIPNLKLKSYASENLEFSSPPPSSHYSSCGEKLFQCDDSDCDNNKGMAIGYVTANSLETPTVCGSFGSCNDYFLDSETGSYRNMSFQEIRNLEQFDSPGYETEGSPLRSSRSRKKNSKNLHRKKNFVFPSQNGIGVAGDKNNNNNTRVWSDHKENGALSTAEGELCGPEDRGESRIDGCTDLNAVLELDGYEANRGNLSSICQSQTSELNSINNDASDNLEFRAIECVESRQLTSNSLNCSFGEDCRIVDLDRADVGVRRLNLRAVDWGVNRPTAGEECSFTREFVSDPGGESNDVFELCRLHDINHRSMSKRSSDFDCQSEFDSIMGDATDDEDDGLKPSLRDRSLNPRVDVNEIGNDNPLLLNSEVVFGASDWDEFAQEVRGNDMDISNQEVDVRELYCHVVSGSTYSKTGDAMEDVRGASNLKLEDFGSSLIGAVEQVLKIMAENGITAVPVASGTQQRTSQVGIPVARSTHYIGIVSIFDVVLHIGENLGDAENSLQTPVAHIIGQTNESRLLWTVDPNTKLIDAMEFLRKGVHRFLVPVQEHRETPYPHEITQYRLLTQTDVVNFLLLHLDEMGPCVMRSVSELGLLDPNLVALAVPSNMTLMTALRLMHNKPVFSSFAVIEPEEEEARTDTYPSWGSGGKLVGSLSATHFRGMGFEDIKMLTPEMTIAEFLKMLASKNLTRPLVTVRPNTPLASVMGAAITNKVHRVWVTRDNGWLMGVVSFSDIIGSARRSPTSFVER